MIINALYPLLREHIGHEVVVVCYGKDGEDPYNIAVECEECGCVLVDADRSNEVEAARSALEANPGKTWKAYEVWCEELGLDQIDSDNEVRFTEIAKKIKEAS